jgi:hypothetical protein
LPHEVIFAGSQQLPSKVMPSLGLAHGVTQDPTPASRSCPLGQAGGPKLGGHQPPSGGGAEPEKFTSWLEPLQRQAEIPLRMVAPGCMPEGHTHARTYVALLAPLIGPLSLYAHTIFIGEGQKQYRLPLQAEPAPSLEPCSRTRVPVELVT